MLKQIVGFSRNIKLRWLNKTLDFMEESQDYETRKETLNQYLSYEISSPDNLRKTRDYLLRIWCKEDENTELKKVAYNLIRMHMDDAVAYHWVLILNAYPVFVDVCNALGGIFEFQDTVSLEQLTKQLFSVWGERTTLYHAIPKMLQTMRDLGVISSCGKGIYQVEEHTISDTDTILFILYAAMHADGKAYYSSDDLMGMRILFPFRFKVTNEQLYQDGRFVIHNTGSALSVSLKPAL